jgi:hypothetical protein
MQVQNREANRLLSTLTPRQLGMAMADLDLTGVPPHKTAVAIYDHLMRVMSGSVSSPALDAAGHRISAEAGFSPDVPVNPGVKMTMESVG